MTKGDKTPLCMSQQSLYLVCSIQIDCKGFIDNWVKRIYLVGLASCISMSSRVACLGFSLWFIIGPTIWLLLPWACMPWTWYASPRDVSHVKELIHFINPVQERFHIKIFTKRRNLNLHSIFIRTWIISSPIMIRKRKSSSPIKIRIDHPPMASSVSHPSVVSSSSKSLSW